MPRNYFGGRVLLPFEMLINLRRIFFGEAEMRRHYPRSVPLEVQERESDERYHLKSLLSVIADSGSVEVFVLDKQDMGYLPDFVLKRVYEQIAQEKEADRPMRWPQVEEMKDRMVRWQRFKVKCVQQLFLRRMQENQFLKPR